jgi:hypothetical protein
MLVQTKAALVLKYMVLSIMTSLMEWRKVKSGQVEKCLLPLERIKLLSS